MTNPKGASFERLIADYISAKLDDPAVDRQIKTGRKDKGDIRGVRISGHRVAIECKNVVKLALAKWVTEAEIERGNLDAIAGVVVHKRAGKGKAQLGETYVTMTLDDLLALIAGERL